MTTNLESQTSHIQATQRQQFTDATPESIDAKVLDLIAKHRLLRMVEGARFLKCPTKGQRQKDKYWLCKLSPNHKTLHYGDLDDTNKTPSIDELPQRLNISDIKRLVIGKDHMKRATADISFSIVYDAEEHLDFVCTDQKKFNYWTDGLNHLLKSDMRSEDFHKERRLLAALEHRMHGVYYS